VTSFWNLSIFLIVKKIQNNKFKKKKNYSSNPKCYQTKIRIQMWWNFFEFFCRNLVIFLRKHRNIITLYFPFHFLILAKLCTQNKLYFPNLFAPNSAPSFFLWQKQGSFFFSSVNLTKFAIFWGNFPQIFKEKNLMSFWRLLSFVTGPARCSSLSDWNFFFSDQFGPKKCTR